jgi:hypothetical protein
MASNRTIANFSIRHADAALAESCRKEKMLLRKSGWTSVVLSRNVSGVRTSGAVDQSHHGTAGDIDCNVHRLARNTLTPTKSRSLS